MNAGSNEQLAGQTPENVTYRVVVASPEEAVRALREKFGDGVEVVSVRAMAAPGIKGLLGSRRFEVLARMASESSPAAPPPPAPESTPEAVEPPPGRGKGLSAPGIYEVLTRAGFSERTLGMLGNDAFAAGSREQATHRSLVAFGEALRNRFTEQRRRPLGRRTAFMGAAGAGRTTALSKWLGRSVFQFGQRGRVFRLELDQPNRAEALDLLCEALGLVLEPLGVQGFGGPVTADFEYLHCPAVSLANPEENAALKEFLDRESVEGRVLVLNAAYDTPVQRSIIRAGRELGATHLVFTHLDEVPNWGRLWDPLIESELAPLFLSVGPSLTGGLELSFSDQLLHKTLPGF